MTALDNLLDARVSHSEIAIWLGISTHAVRLRMIERERISSSQSRLTLNRASESKSCLSINGAENLSASQSPSASKSANTYVGFMP